MTTPPTGRSVRAAVFADELRHRLAQLDRIELRNLGGLVYRAPDEDAMRRAIVERLCPEQAP